MSDLVRAWHFVGDRLRDGRPVPKDGKWLVHEGPVKLCASGLHAARRPWGALTYAPGDTLCLVECAAIEAEDEDKFVCRRRRIVVRADISETLRYFARMQTLSVVHLWDAPDLVLDYLMTGSEGERAAAEAAAWGAARDAAWAAAWGAARAAAWGAAGREFDTLVHEQFADFLENSDGV